ncbi:MAG: ABC transporter permease subunit [Streptosporangiales bacterium]|nr:ABC transporter permease subunit [Streptosporangiales bacterium]
MSRSTDIANDPTIRGGPSRVFAYVLVGGMVVAAVLPLAWLVLLSVTPQSVINRRTPAVFFEPTLAHFREILAGQRSTIVLSLANSLIVSVVSTVVAVVLAALCAYGLARLRPPGHRFISLLILAGRLLPPVALMVPMYIAATQTGLFDTRTALIIPYIALSLPLATWMLQGFFMDLPRELEEAALIDGCNRLTAFVRVILPLAGPGIAAASIFSFILAWNDMAIALTLTLTDAVTLPPFVSQVRAEEGIMWGQLGAITVFIMAPVLLLSFLVQRWIVGGLTGGATKG